MHAALSGLLAAGGSLCGQQVEISLLPPDGGGRLFAGIARAHGRNKADLEPLQMIGKGAVGKRTSARVSTRRSTQRVSRTGAPSTLPSRLT